MGGQVSPAQIYEDYFVSTVFGPWADLVIEEADPKQGERVLDLACGTGALAFRARPLVGSQGSVTGLDLRPGMLAVARSLPGADTIEWTEGDASDLPMPDREFDLVVCQQGYQFFPDRLQAATEMRRVLEPAGRSVVSVWSDLSKQQLFRDLTEVEARHLEPLGVTYEDVAGPFLFGDPDILGSIFVEAGFHDVRVAERTLEVSFPNAERFVENVELAYSAVVPDLAADPSAFEAYVEAVRTDLQPELERYRKADSVVFTLSSNLVTMMA